MKLTVLVDNNVYIDHYYYGEPALSFYIEDGSKKILFDTGYSAIFYSNAQKLGIDLATVSTVVFSHGHNDHTGGLPVLESIFPLKKPLLVAHPLTFLPKQASEGNIGSALCMEELSKNYHLKLTKEPVKLSDRLTFLGEIPEMVPFEPRKQVGETKLAGKFVPDYVTDDSAMVYEGTEGLYIITGCSHSGIVNICEYAKKVTGKTQISGVIGGFHLFEEDQQLNKTIEYFKENHIAKLYPCHCVSFNAKAAIHKQIPIGEVGVGMTVEWE